MIMPSTGLTPYEALSPQDAMHHLWATINYLISTRQIHDEQKLTVFEIEGMIMKDVRKSAKAEIH